MKINSDVEKEVKELNFNIDVVKIVEDVKSKYKTIKSEVIKFAVKCVKKLEEIEKEDMKKATIIKIGVCVSVIAITTVFVTLIIPALIALISYLIRLVVFIAMAVVLGFIALGVIHILCGI